LHCGLFKAIINRAGCQADLAESIYVQQHCVKVLAELFIKVGAKSCPIKFSEQIKTAYKSARDAQFISNNKSAYSWRAQIAHSQQASATVCCNAN
jgi:hypothetical protein